MGYVSGAQEPASSSCAKDLFFFVGGRCRTVFPLFTHCSCIYPGVVEYVSGAPGTGVNFKKNWAWLGFFLGGIFCSFRQASNLCYIHIYIAWLVPMWFGVLGGFSCLESVGTRWRLSASAGDVHWRRSQERFFSCAYAVCCGVLSQSGDSEGHLHPLTRPIWQSAGQKGNLMARFPFCTNITRKRDGRIVRWFLFISVPHVLHCHHLPITYLLWWNVWMNQHVRKASNVC